jgi:hypothetical protein
MDDAHIQTSIDIVYKTIGIYKDFLETHSAISEDWKNDIRQKIKYEEENLQKLKDKHPEFFI